MNVPAPTASDMARDLAGDYALVCGPASEYVRWLETVDAGYPAALRRAFVAEADRARLVADIADMRRRVLDLFPPEQWGSALPKIDGKPDGHPVEVTLTCTAAEVWALYRALGVEV